MPFWLNERDPPLVRLFDRLSSPSVVRTDWCLSLS
jgi:hypothetical protein